MRRRWLVVALALDLLVLAGGEIRAFIVPPSQPAMRTDAVVVLGGLDDSSRDATAEKLVRRSPGSILVLSKPSGSICPRFVTFRPVLCFRPDPDSTRGEARAIAFLAHEYDWRSVTVVTTADQSGRARERVSRCYSGELRMLVAPMPLELALKRLPYENAATVKAELWQRGC